MISCKKWQKSSLYSWTVCFIILPAESSITLWDQSSNIKKTSILTVDQATASQALNRGTATHGVLIKPVAQWNILTSWKHDPAASASAHRLRLLQLSERDRHESSVCLRWESNIAAQRRWTGPWWQTVASVFFLKKKGQTSEEGLRFHCKNERTFKCCNDMSQFSSSSAFKHFWP